MVSNFANICSFICTQLNGFKHRYKTLTIQFCHTIKEFQVFQINTILFYSKLLIRWHAVKLFQVLLSIANNSIKHLSFVYSPSKGQTVLFHISNLFVLNLNVKQFYLTHT